MEKGGQHDPYPLLPRLICVIWSHEDASFQRCAPYSPKRVLILQLAEAVVEIGNPNSLVLALPAVYECTCRAYRSFATAGELNLPLGHVKRSRNTFLLISCLLQAM